METETRYQRVAREQAERQAARARRLKASPRASRKTPEERIADHIDGYDRDDIGLSPDY